jgi:hypothetical protein
MSDSMVWRWVRHFIEGRENVHNDPRSGRPPVVNEDLMRAVEEMIQENRRFTISSLSLHFPQISWSLLHEIVSDKLHGLHHKWHHSTIQGYKNWCPTTLSALTVVETMSQSSVWYVQTEIYMVGNKFLFVFFNSPSELTFSITYIHPFNLILPHKSEYSPQ